MITNTLAGFFTASPIPDTVAQARLTGLTGKTHHSTGAFGGLSTERGDTATAGQIQTAVLGTPRFQTSELASLAADQGPAATIAAAYRRYGPDLLNKIQGHFALAVLDHEKPLVLLAIDRIGVHELYYGKTAEDSLAFSTNPARMTTMDGFSRQLDQQAIYNYIYYHMIPSPGTIYTGISKLGPSQVLIHKSGKTDIHEYWQPVFSEDSQVSATELGKEMHHILTEAVSEAARAHGHIGAFLSGGLDSSTVAGKLAEVRDTAQTYTIGFDAEGYDETPYARMASTHFHTDHHEYFVTPQDVVEALPHIAANQNEPFGNSSVLPAYFCARLAKQNGVDTLLAGDGGDEIFAGNERYAKQKIFEAFFKIPAALRKPLIEFPLSVLPGADRLPLIRKAHSYVRQANIRLPDRLETYNFLHRHEPSEVFSPEFLLAVSTQDPIINQHKRYFQPDSASTLNRMLYLDWKFTLADNDLRKVSNMCHLAGVDVTYPMLDDRLIEFSCKVPSHIKLPGRKLRDFYKNAMRGYLPEDILSKSKHGFGLPFGVWMSDYPELRNMGNSALESLKKRGIFRDEFIDGALVMHNQHAHYYGELVWIMMMLEFWLTQHKY